MQTPTTTDRRVSRRSVLTGLAGLAAGLAVAGPRPAFASAPAILRGKGDFRSIRLLNARTGDRVSTVYWIEGAYIPEAMEAVNYLMRDWREEVVAPIAPATVDIIAAAQRLLDSEEPFSVISGYRTPQTNALLRSRSRGVARNSYHMRAMAADLQMTSRSVRQIAMAGKALAAGGVGVYSRRDFVHYDSGPVRDWGR